MLQQSMQPVTCLFFTAFKGMSRSSLRNGLSRPVRRWLGQGKTSCRAAHLRRCQRQRAAGRQLIGIFINTKRGRDVPMPNQQCQGTTVDAGAPLRVGLECFQFRSKNQRVPGPSVIQWLFPGTVPTQMQGSAVPVPQGEREHADESIQRWPHSPFTKCSQHHFRIATSAKSVSPLL